MLVQPSFVSWGAPSVRKLIPFALLLLLFPALSSADGEPKPTVVLSGKSLRVLGLARGAFHSFLGYDPHDTFQPRSGRGVLNYEYHLTWFKDGSHMVYISPINLDPLRMVLDGGAGFVIDQTATWVLPGPIW